MVEVLLIVLVFFALAGCPPPHVNEAHYLARLKHFWDPQWCAGDLFLSSPEAHGAFVWTLGWVNRWLSLTATAWVGRALAWVLLAWAWRRLSWRIVPVPLVSVLTAALWVTLTLFVNLAGEWVVGGVEAKCFAYVFVLVALRAVVDGHWNRVWLALGAASAFHVLVGGWSAVVCSGIWLVHQRTNAAARERLLKAALSMVPGLVGGGALALVGLVPALALTWHQPAETVAAANQIYVFDRLPHHLAPLSLPPAEAVLRVTRHAALILCLWLLARANQRSGGIRESLRDITRFAWGAVALAAIGFAIELALWTWPATAAALLRYYWFRLTDVAVPLAVALETGALVAAGLRDGARWSVWALAGAIALAAGPLGVIVVERWSNPIPLADSAMRDPAAWADACQWIAENTPPDAVFLTPRLAASFKWRTGRAEVATHKDIPQDARHMVQWFDRLQALYYYQIGEHDEPFNSVGELGTERAAALARRYGAKYIVSDRDYPLALRAIYPDRDHPNDQYVVYVVDD